jgi:hypothetical protein
VDERVLCADIVEKRFWARFRATLIPPAGSASTKESNGTHRRFKDCATSI